MLQAFNWDRRYELDLERVDVQHHHLVNMLNALIEVITEQRHASEEDILQLLDGLEAYAREHFADEERLMAEWGCDLRHIEAHTRQHHIFAEQVRAARVEYLAAGRPRDILELLAGFVTTWLSFHILGSDRDMAGQIARIKAGQPAERRSLPAQERDGGASRILVEAMGRLYELMAQRNLALAAARDELAELNAHLEQRVTERTAALEHALSEVERTREQLLQSEKMSAIGQLAAGVAHEINNPVGFVSSNLGSLQQYVAKLLDLIDRYDARIAALNPPEAVREDIRRLRKQADLDFLRTDIVNLMDESMEGLDRVKKIVRDMRSFSHVDQAEWQEADLNEVLESTLTVVWHELKYKAQVEREYGELPRVRCLPAQLSQVLMNILVNAAQAIERTPGRIVLTTRPSASGVEVAIADNGRGMSEEVMRRIFEPFYTTKAVGKGTGLGLSISYEIVKRHGGEIRVDSRPGEGSRFTLSLPVEPPGAG